MVSWLDKTVRSANGWRRFKRTTPFVFEFKKVSLRRKESLENACEAALLQIEERQYVLELKGSGYETVYPIAIAFEGKNALVQFIKSL